MAGETTHDRVEAHDEPDFEILGALEELALGGGSELGDGFNGWSPNPSATATGRIKSVLDGT